MGSVPLLSGTASDVPLPDRGPPQPAQAPKDESAPQPLFPDDTHAWQGEVDHKVANADYDFYAEFGAAVREGSLPRMGFLLFYQPSARAQQALNARVRPMGPDYAASLKLKTFGATSLIVTHAIGADKSMQYKVLNATAIVDNAIQGFSIKREMDRLALARNRPLSELRFREVKPAQIKPAEPKREGPAPDKSERTSAFAEQPARARENPTPVDMQWALGPPELAYVSRYRPPVDPMTFPTSPRPWQCAVVNKDAMSGLINSGSMPAAPKPGSIPLGTAIRFMGQARMRGLQMAKLATLDASTRELLEGSKAAVAFLKNGKSQTLEGRVELKDGFFLTGTAANCQLQMKKFGTNASKILWEGRLSDIERLRNRLQADGQKVRIIAVNRHYIESLRLADERHESLPTWLRNLVGITIGKARTRQAEFDQSTAALTRRKAELDAKLQAHDDQRAARRALEARMSVLESDIKSIDSDIAFFRTTMAFNRSDHRAHLRPVSTPMQQAISRNGQNLLQTWEARRRGLTDRLSELKKSGGNPPTERQLSGWRAEREHIESRLGELRASFANTLQKIADTFERSYHQWVRLEPEPASNINAGSTDLTTAGNPPDK